MRFAERLSILCVEAFALKIDVTTSAGKAIGVISRSKSLDPSISCFYGETTRDAFGCEKHIPIFFAVRKSLFKIESSISKGSLTVSTGKAMRMPFLLEGIETIRDDGCIALGTSRSYMLFKARLTVFLSSFFNESTFQQLSCTASVAADKMVWAP